MAYWKITRKAYTKFSVRAIRGVLVGYTPSGYIFLNPDSEKFFESLNVRFNEKLVYRNKFRKDAIQHWPVMTENVNLSYWYIVKYDKETEREKIKTQKRRERTMCQNDLLKKEEESAKKRGRP